MNSNADQLSLSFIIPNVSHLLIYRSGWNKSEIMRKVITEILKTGHIIKSRIGKTTHVHETAQMDALHDCAIVNLDIDGLHHLDYTLDEPTEYFIRELNNDTNTLHFTNRNVDIEHNVSCIELHIDVDAGHITKYSA